MRIFKGFILILSAIIIVGSASFYLWKLNGWVYLGFIILFGIIIYKKYQLRPLFSLKQRASFVSRREISFGFFNKKTLISYLPPAIFVFSVSFIVYYLLRHRTDLPIRSPWEVVTWKLFVLYGIAIASFFISLLSEIPKWLKAIFVFAFTFLSFGTALFLYKIGYGFDPFIHRATVKYIDEFGTISPKPFYYIGQYALVLFFHKIFFLPLAWVDKILVPLLASLTLPILFYNFSKKYFENDKINFLTSLTAIILPFSIFIATTPQSLANLFLLILIFVSAIPHFTPPPSQEGGKERINWKLKIENWKFIIALAIMFIHPLSGIPALLFLLLAAILNKIKGAVKYTLSAGIAVLGSVVLPLVFIIRDRTTLQFNSPEILPQIRLFVENKFDLFRNFAYLYRFNFWIIFLGLAVVGVIILIYKKWLAARDSSEPNPKVATTSLILILTSFIIFLNAIFLKIFIKFPEIISYEQADYSNRLIGIAALFLYPLALVPAIYFFKKVVEGDLLVKFFAVLFVTYLALSSFYISYPRVDKFESSHGFSTSKFDIDAVKFIETKAEGKKYIVLANQSVSAAALQEFGFKNRYYSIVVSPRYRGETTIEKIYFYPIPTGGILYQYYLDMVYSSPSPLTATEAIKLVGADELYLVINSYWYNAKNIVREAKEKSAAWWSVGGGRIYIFKYLKSNFETETIACLAD